MCSNRKQIVLLTFLFFLWGFITVLLDSLIPRLKDIFNLSYFEVGMLQFAFFMAYFVFSIPAGIYLGKKGYKNGIVLGLLTMAVGCWLIYWAASFRIFAVFMMAYFVLAGGMTVLQVAANPFVTVLGPEKGASGRLNLAQAFNSLGTSLAPIAGSILVLSDPIKTQNEITLLVEKAKIVYLSNEAAVVQQPFVFLSFVILCITALFLFVRFPVLIKNTAGGYVYLLKNKWLMFGAMGIFLYVGAEVAIGSYLVNYFLDMELPGKIRTNGVMKFIASKLLNAKPELKEEKAIAGAFVSFYWGGAMIGRFFGSYVTRKINPAKVLGIFGGGAFLLVALSMGTGDYLSMWSILGVGFFNSIMFPTIFALALKGVEDFKPQASGILCTMIVGGAIIPPLFGMITDHYGFKTAFFIILLCYLYILGYGWAAIRKNKAYLL